MDIESITSIVKNKQSNDISLLEALNIIRLHIDYCRKYNIDMYTDPLLARVLLWR